MTVKPTHGAYHPTRSPAPGTAWGQMLAIGNLQLDGGSTALITAILSGDLKFQIIDTYEPTTTIQPPPLHRYTLYNLYN